MLTQPSISNTGTGMVYTLYWDAMRRIREKTWTADSTDYHQVFYHDGRTLVQIWNQDDADPNDVTRSIGYDLYRGSTGYLKDIDFEDDPDVESYLIKDDQGTIRSVVKLSYSGGSYTVTVGRYVTDAYGAWMNPASIPSDVHYMRYISSRVEGYGDEANQNQALIHLDHRHYLPYLGIFLQREPLLVSLKTAHLVNISSAPFLLNPYRYTGNRPTLLTDRSGLYCDEAKKQQALDDRDDCMALCRDVYTENESRLDECARIVRKAYETALDDAWDNYRLCVYVASGAFLAWAVASILVGGGLWTVAAVIAYVIAIAACLSAFLRAMARAENARSNCMALIQKWRETNMIQLYNCSAKCQRDFCDKVIAADCAVKCDWPDEEAAVYMGWIANPIWYDPNDPISDDYSGPVVDIFNIEPPCCFYPSPKQYPPYPGSLGPCCGGVQWQSVTSLGRQGLEPPHGELPWWID